MLGLLVAQLLRIPFSGFDNGTLDTKPIEDTRYVLRYGSFMVRGSGEGNGVAADPRVCAGVSGTSMSQ